MNSCLINLGVRPTIKNVLSTDEKKLVPKKDIQNISSTYK